MFLVQAGTFLCFQARRSSATRSSASDFTVKYKLEKEESNLGNFGSLFKYKLEEEQSSTTEFFVFQQSFYWTRRFDPETRAFFGKTKNSVVECKASENVCERRKLSEANKFHRLMILVFHKLLFCISSSVSQSTLYFPEKLIGKRLMFINSKNLRTIQVAHEKFQDRDSCDVTHSLTQASMHTSHVHGSKLK